jgi:hypothetical protein
MSLMSMLDQAQGGRLFAVVARSVDLDEAQTRKAMLVAGWGVIDPLPELVAGDRIEPLPLPASARVRELLSIMEIDASGSAPIDRDGGQTVPVEPGCIATAWAQMLPQRLAVIENDARLKSALTTGV